MSCFKRAEWHSGLTYRQTCDTCATVLQYMDDKLDFRPWFPDGFVYCPTCKKPLRHNERYAVNRPASMPLPHTATAVASAPVRANFCTRCGTAFAPDAEFCANCGNKR